MRDIEDLLKNNKKYKNAILQKRFDSKKNTVGYITVNNKPKVLKWYVPGLKKNLETEYSILNKGSSKLNMPSPFEKDDTNNVISMTYIMGENVCDIINGEKTIHDEKVKIIMLLATWFAQFHKHFRTEDGFFIRGDATLRNFLLSDRIWGVDFEESRKGKPIEDIACMCSSLLSTDPMFTKEKFQLCNIFIKSYQKSVKWNLDDIEDEIAYALLERIQWRPDDEDTLRKFAIQIRKRGIN